MKKFDAWLTGLPWLWKIVFAIVAGAVIGALIALLAHGRVEAGIGVLSVTIAAVAAVGAWLAAKATQRGTEAQLVRELLADYSSSDFSDALRAIREWVKKYGPDAGEELRRQMAQTGQAEHPIATAADHARRRISHYFLTTWRLFELGYLSADALCTVACDQSGFRVMFDDVWNLERHIAHDAPRQLAAFKRLQDWCDDCEGPTRV